MTMKGEPVPPEGLDHIKTLQKWLEQYPNDVMVRAKLAEIQRDPRFGEPDEPDDIMPQIPELAEFPVPPGLKKYIDATRIVAGASVPTSAACIAAAFNLLAAEDIDVQSRANAPHPSGLYFVVGSESGWRKSASFRETMQGHVEADERVEVLHHEADSNTEEGMEFRAKGFSPRALRQDFTIEALLSRLWKARRTMAVANSDASSLLGGWSFRKDNLSRSLSHFVSLWDGDPTSIDRRNPEAPEIFFSRINPGTARSAILGWICRCQWPCALSPGHSGPSQSTGKVGVKRGRSRLGCAPFFSVQCVGCSTSCSGSGRTPPTIPCRTPSTSLSPGRKGELPSRAPAAGTRRWAGMCWARPRIWFF